MALLQTTASALQVIMHYSHRLYYNLEYVLAAVFVQHCKSAGGRDHYDISPYGWQDSIHLLYSLTCESQLWGLYIPR